ncbi:hypothetical protein UFOVP1174_2 [uncultured Caudovirales phage]|uniref:Bacteriophage P22, Gp10, DNA-stabilising n=1 Tax=uncultured Caudovirales phage TaxID=2100421 RepID=A0A6J5QWN8_9CAUD|nr:hypothetical protein UFOVP1174_2 [uncultured Caudovirales phage]
MAAAEQKKSYHVIKQFKGVNTKANRTAIGEDEFSWIENAQPIGFANIKVVNNRSSVKDSGNAAVTFGNTVNHLTSVNLTGKDYLLAFEDDGRAEYFDLTNSLKGNVAVAGTFSSSGVQVGQWKDERALILDPSKGYYTWDGTNLVSVGSIGEVAVTAGGTGYTAVPTVTISAPNDANGVQALANATISGGAVTSIIVAEAGTGYTSNATVTISGGGGASATAVAGIVTFKTGTVNALVTNGGSGYTNAANTVVTIAGGGGSGAAATPVLSGGQIVNIIVTDPGSSYSNSANLTVTISGGGGTNATAVGIINSNDNTGISSFSGRVWISFGRTVAYSAAGSYSDFTSVSAGTIVLTDSTLHGNIQQILSANNFLYIFGDDSINVFSDVRVTSAGVTLFTNTNISASVGSKRKDAIFPYFRSVLFLNDYGVYALVGSTTSKLSDALDGVFPLIDFTSPITAGQVLINNILCSAFNFKQSYFGGSRYVQAVFFDKKWFFTSQGDTLKYVTSAPVGGVINLYGTDTNALYRLYADSTANVSSTIQTSLNPMGDPIRTKQALKFAVEATITNTATINVTVDSETASSPSYSLTNTIGWTNNAGTLINWINNSSVVIYWSYTSGYVLYKSDAQQYGKYLGLTMTSNSPPFVVNTFEFEHELRVRF